MMANKEEKFLEIYNKLNEQQKQAVDHTDGPTMVVAGPGTGKTQILAARIANILKITDYDAYQILCLTFTDAAVVAMRQRLESFIGPAAYQVSIHTFHSLCNEIIQFNSDYFGYKTLQPASDIEVLQVICDIIDELPFNHPLKRLKGDVYYDAKTLKDMFAIIKKENFDIEAIKIQTDRHLQSMMDEGIFLYKKNGKNYKKGDVKEALYQAELESHNKLKAAVVLYEVFVQKMKSKSLYDFDDMILWVINAFKNDSNFLLNYQERFAYFLVDEFQDTNGSQLDLINLLSGYDDVPNLFIVGDEDQSIYRFQGANIDNIINFEKKYKDNLHTTVLVENYRSSQAILDWSKSLIGLNSERIAGIDKNIRASGENLKYQNIEPQIKVYLNDLQEAVGIGQSIKTLHEQGVPYDQIAVLYRNHKHVDNLVKYFKVHGIPFSSKKKVNVLKEILIEKLLTILQYIEAENKKPFSGEPLLFRILNFDFYNIHPLDIAKLSYEISKTKKKWRDFLQEKLGTQSSLFEVISSKDSFSELKRLSADLEYWLKQENNLTLPQLIERIIAKGGVLSYIMHSPEKRWYLQMLRTFFEFVKEQTSKNPKIKINDLINLIDEYDRFEISLDAMQIVHVPDSVNLITLHSSKGLEFDHVFIIKCTEADWKSNNRSNDLNLIKYTSAQTETKSNEKEMEELRRLMFVGMTRARKTLNFSYYQKDLKDKEVNRNQFISELIDLTNITTEEVKINEDDLFEFELAFYQFDETPDFDLIDHGYLDDILKNYTMSATHLNSYLKCPVSFYFNNILKVPSAKNESLAFGSAIHEGLDVFFKQKMAVDQPYVPALEDLIKAFEFSMYKNRDSFVDKSYERYKEHGKNILSAYYEKYKEEWLDIQDLHLEENITQTEVMSVPIKGKLDKIILDGRQAYVVDYKTGKFENAKKKCLPPIENPNPDKFEEVYGGDYWRQMVFYQILINNNPKKNWKMIGGEMDFVEPDKKNEFHKHKFQITDQDIKIVTSQIVDTHDKIKNHEFEKGCGDEGCDWCNFVKYYLKKEILVSDSLPGSEIEETEEV
jgi:DNA helicase II / ATP-dependent DNA helicase PcrA